LSARLLPPSPAASHRPSTVAVIGAGWAGLSAAVLACQGGHQVTLWESTRQVGGRARSLSATDGQTPLDNGQHLLMGAYTHTLDMMRRVGVEPDAVLLDSALDLRWPDGTGLLLPERQASHRVGSQWAMGLAVLHARGWSWRERWALARWSLKWQLRGFICPSDWTVARLCADLPQGVQDQLTTPLCVSALNLAPQHASAQLLLTALQDTVFGAPAHARALVPKRPLGEVFPDAAVRWLSKHGAIVALGHRVTGLSAVAEGIRINQASPVDHVIVATPPHEAARLARTLDHASAQAWADLASQLRHTAIATVYAHAPGCVLARPMTALAAREPMDAQFVFDLGHLGRPSGCLAAVVSDATGDRAALQAHVQAQLRQALGTSELRAHQTVIEKRATFAATPLAPRPPAAIAPRVWACADYVQGRYPATLEGAVRSASALPWSQINGDTLGLKKT
jgi:hydroxysqualene dehydroxylase